MLATLLGMRNEERSESGKEFKILFTRDYRERDDGGGGGAGAINCGWMAPVVAPQNKKIFTINQTGAISRSAVDWSCAVARDVDYGSLEMNSLGVFIWNHCIKHIPIPSVLSRGQLKAHIP